MPFYSDEKQIYSVMQALFDNLQDMKPDPIDALVSTHMKIRINIKDPDAIITINGRKRPVTVDYGLLNGRADLELEMAADTLHLILLDSYSVKDGFTKGELKVRGPIWKALSFSEIFQKGRVYYPKVLEDHNLV